MPTSFTTVSNGQTIDASHINELHAPINTLETTVAGLSGSTNASTAFSSGQVPLARGGTGADLSATGGSSQFLKQTTVGGNISVGGILANDLPANIDCAKLANGTVSNAEFQYLDGVTSGIQTQIDGKAATSHNHAASAVTSGQLALARGGTGADLSATGGTGQVLKQNSAGGVVTVGTLTYTDVGAAAASHTHAASDITSGTIATARLGSGTANSTTYLAGDQTYKTMPSANPPIVLSSVSGTNTITATASGVTMAAGMIFALIPAGANTGATTLNINSGGDLALYRSDGSSDLYASDLVSGRMTLVEYTGTNFRLLTPAVSFPFTCVNYMVMYGFSAGSPGAGQPYFGRDGNGSTRMNNTYQLALTINDVLRQTVMDVGIQVSAAGVSVPATNTFTTVRAGIPATQTYMRLLVTGLGSIDLDWDGTTLTGKNSSSANLLVAASASSGQCAVRMSGTNLQVANNTAGAKACDAGILQTH